MFKRGLLIFSFFVFSSILGIAVAYIHLHHSSDNNITDSKETTSPLPEKEMTEALPLDKEPLSEKETLSELFLSENANVSLDDIFALDNKRKQFVLLCQYADGLTSEDFPDFIQAILINSPDFAPWAVRTFAKRDFEAARELILDQLPSSSALGHSSWKTNFLIQAVFAEWLTHDKEDAIEFLKNMKYENRYYTRDMLFSSLAQTHPFDALKILEDDNTNKWIQNTHYYSLIYTALYEKTPSFAMESLHKIDSEYKRNEALRGILSKMTESDPILALETIHSELSPEDQLSAFQTFFSNITWSQPNIAIELLKSGSLSKDEYKTLCDYIYNINTKDLISLIRDHEFTEQEIATLVSSHLNSHYNGNKEDLEQLTGFLSASQKEIAEENLLTNLSYESAEEVLNRWNNLPQERKKFALLSSILRNMSWRSPDNTITLMKAEFNNPDLTDEDRREIMEIAVNNILPESFEIAAQFINDYGTDEVKETVVLQRMLRDNSNNPLSILRYLSDMKDQSAAQSVYFDQIQTIVHYNQDQLLPFLLNTTKEDWRDSGIDSAMSQLVYISIDASEDFIDQIPKNTPLYENALVSFIEYATEHSPKRALKRALEITSEVKREQIIKDIVERWESESPEAAKAWLKENNIVLPQNPTEIEVEFE